MWILLQECVIGMSVEENEFHWFQSRCHMIIEIVSSLVCIARLKFSVPHLNLRTYNLNPHVSYTFPKNYYIH